MKQVKSTFLFSLIFILLLSTNVFAAGNPVPEIYGDMAITIDVETGEIIYAKNIDKIGYPASTTKLMTALIFAENKKKSDQLTYTQSAKDQPPYSLNTNFGSISIGYKMPSDDAMKALLIYSANDIAYMIADNVAGNTENFIQMMNNKASDLNLKNTNFVTPNGLHDDNHYTSVYDLSVISREAFKNDWILDVSSLKEGKINIEKGSVTFPNRNKNLGINGNIAGKTGYTSPAGRCLTALYERDGRKILGVVMKSIYDSEDSYVFQDMEKIIDWSYNEAEKTTFKPSGSTIQDVTIDYKPLLFFGPKKQVSIPLVIKDEIKYYENDINKAEIKETVNLNDINPFKLNKNKTVGNVVVTQREASNSYELFPTVSSNEIVKANLLLYILSVTAVVVILITILIIISKINKRKARRSRSRFIK